MTNETEEFIDKDLTEIVIGGFYTVYNALDYGFSEEVYARALSLELRKRGLKVERQVPVEVFYLGQPIALYRIDMVIEERLLLEIKASAAVGEVDRRQIFNYLRATVLPLALLLHFGPKPYVKRYISPRKHTCPPV